MDTEQMDTLEEFRNKHMADGDWIVKPAIPASTVEVTNTSKHAMFVEVAGGTVTAVKVDAVTVGARVSGSFYVRPGSTISMTYSVAPTWQWFAAM
jgi:hypothetical protein